MNTLQKVVAGGVAIALAGVAVMQWKRRHHQRRTSDLRDEALDESFPASDPAATQDFSTPPDPRPQQA